VPPHKYPSHPFPFGEENRNDNIRIVQFPAGCEEVVRAAFVFDMCSARSCEKTVQVFWRNA